MKERDLKLFQHLENIGFSCARDIWSWFSTLFSNLLNKKHLLCLFDYLILHHEQPELILYFPVAYLFYFRKAIFRIKDLS